MTNNQDLNINNINFTVNDISNNADGSKLSLFKSSP